MLSSSPAACSWIARATRARPVPRSPSIDDVPAVTRSACDLGAKLARRAWSCRAAQERVSSLAGFCRDIRPVDPEHRAADDELRADPDVPVDRCAPRPGRRRSSTRGPGPRCRALRAGAARAAATRSLSVRISARLRGGPDHRRASQRHGRGRSPARRRRAAGGPGPGATRGPDSIGAVSEIRGLAHDGTHRRRDFIGAILVVLLTQRLHGLGNPCDRVSRTTITNGAFDPVNWQFGLRRSLARKLLPLPNMLFVLLRVVLFLIALVLPGGLKFLAMTAIWNRTRRGETLDYRRRLPSGPRHAPRPPRSDPRQRYLKMVQRIL